MKITIRYTRKGETTEVSTSLLTVVAWERKFKRKASDMGNGMGIEDIAFLAFEASKQHKVVESIEVVSEETENPTPAAPPDEH
jgi:hypothetical protein